MTKTDTTLATSEKPERLAYTMKETAAVIGVSYITIWRLVKRGLLRTTQSLRIKLIPKTEIERFLRDECKEVAR